MQNLSEEKNPDIVTTIFYIKLIFSLQNLLLESV